ncbi:MAG: hypothetical protein M3N05_07505 [Pseudomonadota bacterium]|nr:hypothetical protein [Pseudomonadota bacterium]
MPDRQNIAKDIVVDLVHSEQAFDTAYAAITAFCSRLPAYQSESRLSPVSSQKALRSFTRAAALIAEARGELVDGHNSLEALRRAMKLSPVTTGGPTDKPPPDAPAGFDTMMSHVNPAE